MRKLIVRTIFTFAALFTGYTAFGQNRQFKNEFLYRINLTRQKGCNCGIKYYAPAPPLTWNDKLQDAAEEHAKDMARQNYFDHTSKDGRSMQDRIITAGYKFKGYKSFAIGENIAAGQQSIAEVMDGWFKSEGHCKNLMNPSFKEIGVAENHKYWVQDFGGRESFTPEQQKLIRSGQLHVVQGKLKSHD